jgi:hypothetical protein
VSENEELFARKKRLRSRKQRLRLEGLGEK